MRKIKTWRNPYDEGFSTCRKKEVEFKPGLTVLVGCNGAGKTTMLKNIESELNKEKIPVFLYDNESHGGDRAISESVFNGNFNFAATAWCSSEGENICLNLCQNVSKFKEFIETGTVNTFAKRCHRALGYDEDNEITSNERWILLDAMDSGYSIDNVIEMKDLFYTMIEDCKEKEIELYIVISSNEYELVSGSDCFDVTEGKYISFSSYDDYKKFILHTRKKKDKRYQ